MRRGAVYTRPAKSSERNPLEPRDVNDNAFYGSSGRIRHRGRKLALNGKTSWVSCSLFFDFVATNPLF